MVAAAAAAEIESDPWGLETFLKTAAHKTAAAANKNERRIFFSLGVP